MIYPSQILMILSISSAILCYVFGVAVGYLWGKYGK